MDMNEIPQSAIETGVVKWFSRLKGYGFILPDDGGADVFAHYSAISGEGYRNLRQGDRVEYLLVDKGKGPQAANIVALSETVAQVAHQPAEAQIPASPVAPRPVAPAAPVIPKVVIQTAAQPVPVAA